MNWIKDFSKYKKVMQVLLGLGLLSLLISYFIELDSMRGFLTGFGSSITAVAGINILVMFAKQRKDEDYEREMNIEFTDERLRINKLKVLAYSGIIGMMALALSNAVHLVFDNDLLISNIVVVFIYVISLIGLKLYYRNK